MAIQDLTGTNLVSLRRTIYLTIMSSLDFEECAHKLLKMTLQPGMEVWKEGTLDKTAYFCAKGKKGLGYEAESNEQAIEKEGMSLIDRERLYMHVWMYVCMYEHYVCCGEDLFYLYKGDFSIFSMVYIYIYQTLRAAL